MQRMDIQDLDVGMRLRLERVSRRLTQRVIAYESGIQRCTLSEIECGWRKPTPTQLAAICQAIGISPSDLGDDVDR